MHSGKLITFEGLDGCGKSTQLEKANDWLSEKGFTVQTTREPGGTVIGQQIRNILLNPEHEELQPESELLLYLADRIQHLQESILPEIAAGKIVLCDRFHDSTVAYQGYGRGLDLISIESIVEHCIKPYAPDLTILLNISPETVAARLNRRQEHAEKDRLDSESLSFFTRVAQGFEELSAAEPERFVCLNGEQEIEVIHQEIIDAFQQRLRIT
ncbi:MAG: dTMP kinase [SAR324 cluster bacterium]|jgi:dTMP kinase|nr:dTMP kinase [SAR324 cluster bacterium]MCH2264871.1 dTMP kinase [SAR324 cluster bacterium]|tara:strand:- start:13 stop:651 length:639 start_codon:yes stop_codon:yes gene_type:complete